MNKVQVIDEENIEQEPDIQICQIDIDLENEEEHSNGKSLHILIIKQYY